MKNIQENSATNIIFNGNRLNVYPLRSGMTQLYACLFSKNGNYSSTCLGGFKYGFNEMFHTNPLAQVLSYRKSSRNEGYTTIGGEEQGVRHTEKLRERNKENIEKCKQLKVNILLFTVIFPPPPLFYIIDKKKKLKFWKKFGKKF